MTLGLQAGEMEWDRLQHEMPPEVFAGWKQYAKHNPQGSRHFYKFLGHAFCLLAQSFHNKEKAFGLRWEDFCWWVPPSEDPADDDGMSDEDCERYFDKFAQFGR